MGLNRQFWNGRRVLVTGHTGFKGGWLSLWLQELGAEVTGYALAPGTVPNLFEVAGVASGMRSILGDVKDPAGLEKAFAEASPEVVLHLAAQPLVRRSYTEPVETYATNVLGTVNVLEAARRSPDLRAFVSVTSDKCYANREWVWPYRETDALGGHDPYSNSKACAELVTAAYRDSFFRDTRTAVATVRAGNVIGGGDWTEDRLIPDIFRAVAAGSPVRIRNPRSIRPWQHVLEPLSGYLRLAELLAMEGDAWAEAWNFGPEVADAQPVSRIVGILEALSPGLITWEIDPGPHPAEAGHLTIDSSKSRQRLGWRPRWTLPETMRLIVDWHRSWSAGSDMRAACQEEIALYERTGR